MTITQMIDIVNDCKSPGMEFYTYSLTRDHIEGDHYYLQVEFDSYNSWDQTTTKQKGRKWLLSEHMTKNEIVQTCFLAVMTAVEHELRENFRYKGRPIFGPHWDPNVLWEMSRKRNLDLRTERVAEHIVDMVEDAQHSSIGRKRINLRYRGDVK